MTTNSGNCGNAQTPRRTVPPLAEDLAAMTGRPGPRREGVHTSGSRSADTAQPRMFGQHGYVLPNTVRSNVARHASANEPTRFAYARGFLVELNRLLSYRPLSLYVRLCTDSVGNPTAVVITVIAVDENDEILTVVWRQERGLDALGPNDWQLTINGAVPHGGTGRLRPAPPMFATIVSRALNT
jgi:hypothetical protein